MSFQEEEQVEVSKFFRKYFCLCFC